MEELHDSRLVKVITEKMGKCGSVSWKGKYDLLLSKYGLEGSEMESAQEWKERIHETNCKRLDGRGRGEKLPEVVSDDEGRSGIGGVHKISVDQEGVRLWFQLRTGSAGLFRTKNGARCVLCNSGETGCENTS